MSANEQSVPAHLEAEVRYWHMHYAKTWMRAMVDIKTGLTDAFLDNLPDTKERKVWVANARLKSVDSVWKKLLHKMRIHADRPAPESPEALSTFVQDIAGIRVLTTSLEYQRRATKWLLNYANTHDLGIAAIDDYVSSPKPSGYRAVHITLLVPIEPEDDDIEPHVLHLEVQIHTLLQHAWCEITHDEGYKSADEWPAVLHQTSSQVAQLLHQADSLAATLYHQATAPLPIIRRADAPPAPPLP